MYDQRGGAAIAICHVWMPEPLPLPRVALKIAKPSIQPVVIRRARSLRSETKFEGLHGTRTGQQTLTSWCQRAELGIQLWHTEMRQVVVR